MMMEMVCQVGTIKMTSIENKLRDENLKLRQHILYMRKEIQKGISLLASDDDLWDDGMDVLFNIIGKKSPGQELCENLKPVKFQDLF